MMMASPAAIFFSGFTKVYHPTTEPISTDFFRDTTESTRRRVHTHNHWAPDDMLCMASGQDNNGSSFVLAQVRAARSYSASTTRQFDRAHNLFAGFKLARGPLRLYGLERRLPVGVSSGLQDQKSIPVGSDLYALHLCLPQVGAFVLRSVSGRLLAFGDELEGVERDQSLFGPFEVALNAKALPLFEGAKFYR